MSQQVMNAASRELGTLIIEAVMKFASEGEHVAALVEASSSDGGTPDAERCAIVLLPVVMPAVLETVPGSPEMKRLLLEQLAANAAHSSRHLG